MLEFEFPKIYFKQKKLLKPKIRVSSFVRVSIFFRNLNLFLHQQSSLDRLQVIEMYHQEHIGIL